MKATLVVPTDVRVDALDSKVHLRQPPGRVVDLLTIDRDVLPPPTVLLNEFFRLDEHATRAAAGIVSTALVGLQHLDERADNRAGREELASALAFGPGEAREEVLVDPAQQILCAVRAIVHADVGEQVD